MAETKEVGQEIVAYDEIAAAIAGEGEVTVFVEDPVQISKDILARILSAETPEQVLGQGQAVHAGDILGRPFQVNPNGLRFHRSAFADSEKGGPSVFAVLSVTFADSGESAAVTCGSRNVMGQLLSLSRMGALEGRSLAIQESGTATAAGYKPMWLVDA